MRIKKLLLTVLAVVAIERFCYVQTAGFRLGKIHSDFVYEAGYPQQEEKKPEVLNRPFKFLGSGVQCYAFLSQDGTTVLKVFKHYHNFPIEGFWKKLPLPPLLQQWRAHLLERRVKRLQSIFSSCELAYNEYRQESGTLFLHLQPTNTLKQTLTLIDKLGIAHQVDLDTTAFVLQKKVEMLPEKMKNLQKKGDLEGIRECLSSLSVLIDERCKKGITNSDLRLERNIGFIGARAVEIDLGSFQKMRITEREQEIEREQQVVKRFLQKNYPKYVEEKAL